MLRALRPSTAPLALRRLVAALLVVLLGGASAEPLLADACDGDAPRAAWSGVLPHVDGVTVVGETLAAVAGVADARVGVPSPAPVLLRAPAAPTGDQGTPQHAVHVCHCTHAHGGTLAEAPTVRTRALTRAGAPAVAARSDRLPPSPPREPQLRPPALPHAA